MTTPTDNPELQRAIDLFNAIPNEYRVDPHTVLAIAVLYFAERLSTNLENFRLSLPSPPDQ